MKQTPPHTIKLTLQKDGTLTAKVEGINGPGCQGVTDWLEQLGEIVERSPTAEFYSTATTATKTGLNLGGNW